MMTITACLLLLLFATALAQRKSYEGYAVIEVRPEDEEHLALLRRLMINDQQTDFWAAPRRVGRVVSIMLSPEHISNITSRLRNSGMIVRFSTHNVQKRLSQLWSEVDSGDRRRALGEMNLDYFNTLEKIYRWMNNTVPRCRDDVQCEVYSAGQSFEGRPINVFKISKPGLERKAYWIDATIHAREWISTATAVKIIDHLARGGDADAERLVDQYDWYIMPVVNPDGYSYTYTDERYWRKNRRVKPGQRCVGVDLNRNFDVAWGTEGVSYYPCSEVYCGPGPASEPETLVVQAEAGRLASQLRGWLTMHSFGQMWMFPFATTLRHHSSSPCERASDHDDLMEVANAAADAVGAKSGTHWQRGNSCEVIYAAAGGTDDYVKAVHGVKYSFVAELRGDDFVVDHNQIQPSFEEMWSGIVAMCDTIAAKEDRPPHLRH